MFSLSFGSGFRTLFLILLSLFAFASVISWCYYAECCIAFLFPKRNIATVVYRIAFVSTPLVMFLFSGDEVFLLADILNALMLFINLFLLYKCRKETERISSMWYHENTDALLKELNASPKGLSYEEASRRLEKYSENTLSSEKKKGFFRRYFESLCDRMTVILLIAAIISGVSLWGRIDVSGKKVALPASPRFNVYIAAFAVSSSSTTIF